MKILIYLKYLYKSKIKKVCPGCNEPLEMTTVYSIEKPYINCGECGYIYDKGHLGEILNEEPYFEPFKEYPY